MDTSEQEQKVKVGVGVMVFKDGKVLLGKRKGAHGVGDACPGGHLEYMESFEECAKRECMEECGIEIQNIKFSLVANITKYKPKHYVHIGLTADWKSGEPKVFEPERCEGWGWYDLDDLPNNTVPVSSLSFTQFKTGQNYFPSVD